jgi:proline reductase-associated electron transfer protein PrdC
VKKVTPTALTLESEATEDTGFVPLPKTGDLVEQARLAGLVGMGGAGFPTWVKLASNLEGGTLIANAVECEPLLKHNTHQLENDPDQVRRGLLLAIQATKAKRGVIAVKKKNRAALAALAGVIREKDPLEVFTLPDLYPVGEERALVREILGILLPPDQLPLAAGAVVMNVETLASLAAAWEDGKPVISKNLTMAGKLGGNPIQVFTAVPIGTSFQTLLDKAGGPKAPNGGLLAGGPFTGSYASEESTVSKTLGGICVTQDPLRENRPLGLLVCACSASEERLRQLAASMGARVTGVRRCQQAVESRGGLKCENPGNCPGQAAKILELRREGAEALLIGNCSDCTNTVMCVAPGLKMAVHHVTDNSLRAAGKPLVRRLPALRQA